MISMATCRASARLKAPVPGLPNHQGELQVERHMSRAGGEEPRGKRWAVLRGVRAYKHFMFPASVDQYHPAFEFLDHLHALLQPEIAQGTLQTMFEFQTQVAALTGMEGANASMYDGSTACAEAAMMACRTTKRRTVVLSGGLHPHYADDMRTVCEAAGYKVVPAGARRWMASWSC